MLTSRELTAKDLGEKVLFCLHFNEYDVIQYSFLPLNGPFQKYQLPVNKSKLSQCWNIREYKD